ncbi:MAG TPA: sigma 54-interacting transcriptional regulator, partial [Polyangium sp.]|nr:sigma 54-interacting transcriptional regulator [Polyangium sp.]
MPVGESKAMKNIDVTFVAATNRPLDVMVEAGTFRLDLQSRFAPRLYIPPLRERPEDIFAILQTLYKRRGQTLDPEGIDIEALERLLLFPWKGNVRELELLVTHLAPSRELRLQAIGEVLGPSADELGKRPLTREQV